VAFEETRARDSAMTAKGASFIAAATSAHSSGLHSSGRQWRSSGSGTERERPPTRELGLRLGGIFASPLRAR